MTKMLRDNIYFLFFFALCEIGQATWLEGKKHPLHKPDDLSLDPVTHQ